MMLFLQVLRNYWIIIILAVDFIAGYHLRAIQYGVEQEHAMIRESQKINKADSSYVQTQDEIARLYDNLNTKVTYENSYNCIIPIDGLRLLTEATR